MLANKISVADGGKAVVLVTADQNGHTDAVNDAYSVYYVTNGATSGLSDVTVQLVGTIHCAAELEATDLLGAFA